MPMQNGAAKRRAGELIAGLRSSPGRIGMALASRNFRLLWMGAFTSSVGTWMQKVAQAWLIVTMARSRSAFYLGLDGFLGELPLLLFTMMGGVIADRRGQRPMILLSQMVQMLIAFLLAGLIFAGRVRIAQVLALSFVAGCARAFGGPAYQSLLPVLVKREHVPNAIALNSIQFNLAQVMGPLVAGATLAAFGMVACFGLNGISFLFVIAAVLALRDVPAPGRATESIGTQLGSGLRFVKGSPHLVTVMAVGFCGAFFGGPLLTFLPVMTRDVFHRDAGFYTRLMTFSGAGAVGGALIVAWLGGSRPMRRMLLLLPGALGAAVAGFGLSKRMGVSVLILFAAGALFVMCSSLTTSLAQLMAPAEMRGRVISVYLVAIMGGAPLGSLASGWLVTRTGSAPAMLEANGMALMAVALCFLIRDRGFRGRGFRDRTLL